MWSIGDLNVTQWFGCGSLGTMRTAVTYVGMNYHPHFEFEILLMAYISTRGGRKRPFPFGYREILSLLMYFRKTSAVFVVCLLQIGQSGDRRSLKIAN